MKKRILSLVLCVAMIATFLPISTLADVGDDVGDYIELVEYVATDNGDDTVNLHVTVTPGIDQPWVGDGQSTIYVVIASAAIIEWSDDCAGVMSDWDSIATLISMTDDFATTNGPQDINYDYDSYGDGEGNFDPDWVQLKPIVYNTFAPMSEDFTIPKVGFLVMMYSGKAPASYLDQEAYLYYEEKNDIEDLLGGDETTAITAVAVGVTPPVRGASPDTEATPEANYTAGDVTWDPDDDPFEPETQYTATVTLYAKEGFVFNTATAANFKINENTAVIKSGGTAVDSITLEYEFDATDAAALTPVSTIAITGITPPANGVAPSTATPSYGTGVATGGAISWDPDPTTFVGGQQYTVTIPVVPASTFVFTASPAATVNGISSGVEYTGDTTAGSVTYTFTATNTVINAVPVTMTAPATGGSAATAAASAFYGTGYENNGDFTWDPSDATFLGGTSYMVTIPVRTTTGYEFAPGATGTVNGYGSFARLNATTGTLTRTFDATGKTAITAAAVTVAPPPAANQALSGTTATGSVANVTQSSPYTINWTLLNDTSYSETNFGYNTQYKAKVTLTADTGYEFDSTYSSAYTINGQAATVATVSEDKTTLTLTYTFPATLSAITASITNMPAYAEYNTQITPTVSGTANGVRTYKWQKSANGEDGWTDTGSPSTITPNYIPTEYGGYLHLVVTDSGAAPDANSVTSAAIQVYPKSITYGVTPVNREYDGTATFHSAPTFTPVGVVDGDTVSVTLKETPVYDKAGAGGTLLVERDDVQITATGDYAKYRISTTQGNVTAGTISTKKIASSALTAPVLTGAGLTVPDAYVGVSKSFSGQPATLGDTITGITLETLGIALAGEYKNVDTTTLSGAAIITSIVVTLTNAGTGNPANYEITGLMPELTLGTVLANEIKSVTIKTPPTLSYVYGSTTPVMTALVVDATWTNNDTSEIAFANFTDAANKLGVQFVGGAPLPVSFAWDEHRHIEVVKTAGVALDSNLDLGEIVVTPKQLSAADLEGEWLDTKTYNGNTDVPGTVNVTVKSTSLIGSDGFGITVTNPVFDSANAGTNRTIQAPIVAAGSGTNNNRYTLAPETFIITGQTISPLTLGLVGVPTATKEYDGTTTGPVGTPLLTNFGTLTVTPTYTYTDANAGTSNRTVNISYTVNDPTPGNYITTNLTSQITTGTITQKQLTTINVTMATTTTTGTGNSPPATGTGATAAVSGNANTITSSEIINGDNVEISFNYSYPETVGTQTVTVTTPALTTTGQSGNYVLSGDPTLSGSITLTATQITAVAVTGVIAPVTGASPGTPQTTDGGYDFGTITWTPTVSSTFAGGQVYAVSIPLIAKDGYEFASGVTATLAGTTASVSRTDAKHLTLTRTYLATANTVITTVTVTDINAPVGGGAPDYAATIVVDPTAGISWNPTLAWLQGGAGYSGNFGYNTAYAVRVIFQAQAGYEFSDDFSNYTINGHAHGWSDGGASVAAEVTVGKNQLTLTYTFPATDKPDINKTIIMPTGQQEYGVEIAPTFGGDTHGTLSYQWERSTTGTSGWTPIDSETEATYTPIATDIDSFVRLVVSDTGANDTHNTVEGAAARVYQKSITYALAVNGSANKPYDGTNAVATGYIPTFTPVGVVGVDTVYVTLKSSSLPVYNDANSGGVNANSTLSVATANVEITGAQAGYYRLATQLPVAVGTIQKKVINLADLNKNDFVGLTIPDAYVGVSKTFSSLPGTLITTGVGSETLNISASGYYDSTTVETEPGEAVVTFTAGWTDGDNGEKASNYTVSGTFNSAMGTVLANQIVSATISTQPKTTYVYGEPVDLSGLVVNATWAIGPNTSVTYAQLAANNLDVRFVDGDDPTNIPSTFAWEENRKLEVYKTTGTDFTTNPQTTNRILVNPKQILTGDLVGAWDDEKTYDGFSAVPDLSKVTLTINPGVAVGTDTVGVTVGTAVFTDPNAGTNKTIRVTGLSNLSLNGAQAARYTLEPTYFDITGLTIAPKSITLAVEPSAPSKVYDGNRTLVVANLETNESGIKVSATYTFDDANAGAGNKSGAIAYGNLQGGIASNYNITGVATTFDTGTITPKPITAIVVTMAPALTDGDGLTKTGHATAAINDSNPNKIASSEIINGDNVELSFTYSYPETPGIQTVEITSEALTAIGQSGNYELSSTDFTGSTITLTLDALTGIALKTLPAGGTYPVDLDLSLLEIEVTKNSGATEVFTGLDTIEGAGYTVEIKKDGTVVNIPENSQTLKGNAGTYTIKVSKGGLEANTNALTSIKVAPKNLTIGTDIILSFDADKVYDGTSAVKGDGTPSPTYTIPGLVSGDALTLTLGLTYVLTNSTSADDAVDAGNWYIKGQIAKNSGVEGKDRDNYTINNSPANLYTVILGAGEITKATLNLTGSQFTNVPDAQVGSAGTGNGSITLTGVGVTAAPNVAINYTYTYTGGTTTPNAGAAVSILTATAVPDNYNINVSGDATGVVKSKTITNVALTTSSNSIVYGTAPSGSSNTTVAANSLLFTIHTGGETIPNVTFEDLLDVYGMTVTINSNAVSKGDTVDLNFGDNAVQILHTSSAAVPSSGAPYVNSKITVTPKQLTASVTADVSKTYDGTATATGSNATINGVIPGDIITVTTNYAFTSATVDTGKTVNVTFSKSGEHSDRYTLPPTTTTTANITQATLTVNTAATFGQPGYVNITSRTGYNATAYDVLQGETNPVTVSGTITGVNGETVSFTGTVAYDTTPAVPGDNDATLTVTGFTGTYAGNYLPVANIHYTADDLTGNVVAKSITSIVITTPPTKMEYTYLTDTALDYDGLVVRVYYNDGSDVYYTYTSGAWSPTLPTGITLTIDFSDGTTPADFWGTNGKRLRVSGGGFSALTNPIVVNPATLSIDAITFNNKAFDGTTTATVASRTFNIVSPETNGLALNGTYNFADKNYSSSSIVVNGTGLSISGPNAERYNLTPTTSGTANITQYVVPKAQITGLLIPVMLKDSTTTSANVAETNKVSLTLFSETVPLAYTVTYPNVSVAGKNNIPVVVTNITSSNLNFAFSDPTSFPINTYGTVLEGVPTKIVITTPPQLTYVYGEEVDFSALRVTVYYGGDSSNPTNPEVYEYDELQDAGVSLKMVNLDGSTNPDNVPAYFVFADSGQRRVKVSVFGVETNGDPKELVDVTTNPITITPRTINLTATVNTRPYNTSETATGGALAIDTTDFSQTLLNAIAADNLTVSATGVSKYEFYDSDAHAITANAGTWDISITGTPALSVATKYTLGTVTGTGTITPYTIHVTNGMLTVPSIANGAPSEDLTVELTGSVNVHSTNIGFTVNGLYNTSTYGQLALVEINSAGEFDDDSHIGNYVLDFSAVTPLAGTINPTELTGTDDVGVTGITLPVALETDSTSTQPAGTGYTVQSSEWNTALVNGKFAGSTTYTRQITLVAALGYTFSSGITAGNISALVAGGTVDNVSVALDGSTVSFTVEYDETAATISVTVNYQDGVTPDATLTALVSVGVLQPASPSRTDGYTFKGWYTSSTGNTAVGWPILTLTGGDTVYAQWTKDITATNATISTLKVGELFTTDLGTLLGVADGVGTYEYTKTGTLPDGLTLDDDGTLHGTPTAAKDTPTTVQITITALGDGATKDVTLTFPSVAKGENDFTLTNPVPSGLTATRTVQVGDTFSVGTQDNKVTVTYSSNSGNATVDEYGVVSGVTAGTAEITVRDPGNNNYVAKEYKITVTVTAQPTFGLTLAASPAEAVTALIGGGDYPLGAEAEIKAEAKTGYVFIGWTGGTQVNFDDDTVPETKYTTTGAAETLTANFLQKPTTSPSATYDLNPLSGENHEPPQFLVDERDFPVIGLALDGVPLILGTDYIKSGGTYILKDDLLDTLTTTGSPYTLTFVTADPEANVDVTITVTDSTNTGGPGGGATTLPQNFTVTFVVGEKGKPAGTSKVVVKVGEKVKADDVPAVSAVNEKIAFLGWTPNGGAILTPEEVTELAVSADTTYTAVLLEKDTHEAFMIGTNGAFLPKNGVTRAEVAAMVARIMIDSVTLPGTYPTDFNDVKSGAWYANYIGYVCEAGIMVGYGDGSFHPESPITRQEYAKVVTLLAIKLNKIKDIAVGTPSFDDAGEVSAWAVNYIYTAQSNGWMTGNGNKVEPQRDIARDEAAKVLVELLGRKPSEEGIGNYPYIRFTDQPADWAKYYVIEATNSHESVWWNGTEYWWGK